MFYVIKNCSNYRDFTIQCNKAILNYKKNIHCIVFLERLKLLVKDNQDRHNQYCTSTEEHECRFSRFYKVVLFYLQNELDYQEKDLPFSYFKKSERRTLDHDIEEMVNLLPMLKQVNKGNYMKLKLELNEMKSYYFLDKKNWKQLFLGKIMVLQNSQVISSEQSATLIEKIEKRFFAPV